jgi:ribose/xylose/arabinose/galactoside ABC-type transport system permease subunit
MLIAYGYVKLGISPLITMPFSILVGVGLGALMGAAIHYLNVPPFITTLTGNFLARGVCSLISRESISIDHPLITAKHTVVTPHVAFATKEAFIKRAYIIFENIKAYMNGTPQNVKLDV